jgi:hypothetical protein
VKSYNFGRNQGMWMLQSINIQDMKEKDGESFFDFFARFATDSLFQTERVHEPLQYVTIDPDDEFSILETTMETGQWFAFKPVLPQKRMTNINYGQQLEDSSPNKIVALKGIDNGFSNVLYFKQHRGKWELYKFEDTGV